MATGDGTPRIYDITDPADIASGNLNGSQLRFEISQDPALGLLTPEPYILTKGDEFSIFFGAPLAPAEITALDAIVLAHDGVATFGGYQFFESNAAQLVSVENYQDVFVATTQALRKGVYIVTWNAECRVVANGPLNSACQGRIKIAGNNKGLFSWSHQEWQTHSGWDRQRFDEGEIIDLTMQFRRDPGIGGNDDVEIRRMKFGIEIKED